MPSRDLEIAVRRLKRKRLALVITKNGRVIYETSSHGITGLLEAIEKIDGEIEGSSVADKIVGKAAALLCAYSRASAVFAVTASEKGILVLRDHGVICQFEKEVPHILNATRNGVCPFENLVINISDPEEAYVELKCYAAERSPK